MIIIIKFCRDNFPGKLIIDLMEKNGLLELITKKQTELWIYKNGFFFGEKCPNGISRSRFLKRLAKIKEYMFHIYIDGKLMLKFCKQMKCKDGKHISLERNSDYAEDKQ